jgi:hypothetical protein
MRRHLVWVLAASLLSPAVAHAGPDPKAKSGRPIVGVVRGWNSPAPVRSEDTVTVYRGIYAAPERYNPRRLASRRIVRNYHIVKEKIEDIWVHTRLDGAMSYASGNMTRQLAPSGTGDLPRSVILAFEFPRKLLKWETDNHNDRAFFLRSRVPDDRAFLSQIGVVNLKDGQTISWMKPEEFYLRYKKPK